jgi:hypothetical protein
MYLFARGTVRLISVERVRSSPPEAQSNDGPVKDQVEVVFVCSAVLSVINSAPREILIELRKYNATETKVGFDAWFWHQDES